MGANCEYKDKTKVIIFNKGGKVLKSHVFYLDNVQLENVQSYCYLGIMFMASGSFKNACIRLNDLATRALFKLKSINVRDNIVLANKLFNSLILPIVTIAARFGVHSYCKKSTPTIFTNYT